jgi:hypothetical protein
MSIFSKIHLLIIILNGIHNGILAWILRGIVKKMGHPMNLFTRSLSDQIFLHRQIKSENEEALQHIKFLRYSVIVQVTEYILFILFVVTLPIGGFKLEN